MKNAVFQTLKKNNISIDYDVFSYGFDVFKNYFIFLLLLIPLGIHLNLLLKAIMFIILYIPLRRFIGGFHFNKRYLCTFFSVVFSLMIPFISDNISIDNIYFLILCYIILLLLTYKMGTIDHPNKRLSCDEKKIYKSKALFIESIYCLLNIVCLLLKADYFASLFFFTSIFSVLGISISYLFNKIRY